MADLHLAPAPALAHDSLALLFSAETTEQLGRVIPQETTVLLTGETGTGKSRLAQRMHHQSPRRAQPFLVVDCGALSPTLIESELFGHVHGAFTGASSDRQGKFAAAARGTLLLDEINSLPIHLQNKLLRVVDERTFEPVGSDVPQPFQARIIVASSLCLQREAELGRFRADLFYRLNIVSFHLPPLRQRPGAVAVLAAQFLAEFAARRPQAIRLSPQALALLQRYSWPGNIRELKNVLERAVALLAGTQIEPLDLPHGVRDHQPLQVRLDGSPTYPDYATTLVESKAQVEFFRITQALRKHQNNRLRAAAELGISRMSLYKKLHKYGLMHSA